MRREEREVYNHTILMSLGIALIVALPVIRPLLPGAIFPPLPLLCCFHLSVWKVLDAETSARLIVTVSRPLDVLDGKHGVCLGEDVVNEGVCHSLVGWTQKSKEE